MINFKDYIFNYKKKFVCIEFSNETNANFLEYAKENNFDLTLNYDQEYQSPKKFNFHLTIFYTSTSHHVLNQEKKIDDLILIPKKLELMGKNKDIPVIKIEVSKKLKEIRDIFVDEGFKDEWGEYKPHISMTYKRSKNYDLESIPLPKFPIIANKIIVKDQQY